MHIYLHPTCIIPARGRPAAPAPYVLISVLASRGSWQYISETMILQAASLQRASESRSLAPPCLPGSHVEALLTSKNYEVYLAPAAKIPNILHEIGRLREITFREIGEGTNKAIDLDNFDGYYHHMFLWDTEAKCLAGAYRMGLGSEIFKAKGIDGFYLQDLFRFEPCDCIDYNLFKI